MLKDPEAAIDRDVDEAQTTAAGVIIARDALLSANDLPSFNSHGLI